MTPSNPAPYIIGVSGGSCSGKTTLSHLIVKALGDENCSILFQDCYYHDQSANFDRDGGQVNFDHPDSIDFDFMTEQLSELKKGQAIDVPIYDFVSHSRKKETTTFPPKTVILLDGILILTQEKIRNLLDESVFLEADEEIRFQRRIERDVKERGRTEQGVKDQFLAHVKPMHDQFVEPSKDHATKLLTMSLIQDYLEDLNRRFSSLS